MSKDREQPLSLGTIVSISTPQGRGVVRFYGTTSFQIGKWVGIELNEPIGKNDGSVQGVSYFTCRPNHGVFIRPSKIIATHGSELDAVRIIRIAKCLSESHFTTATIPSRICTKWKPPANSKFLKSPPNKLNTKSSVFGISILCLLSSFRKPRKAATSHFPSPHNPSRQPTGIFSYETQFCKSSDSNFSPKTNQLPATFGRQRIPIACGGVEATIITPRPTTYNCITPDFIILISATKLCWKS